MVKPARKKKKSKSKEDSGWVVGVDGREAPALSRLLEIGLPRHPT